MLVLEIVLVQLLLACALALTCALQLCLHAFAPRAGNFASALHIQVEHILGEGQRGPNGKQLAVLFLPPMVSWVVDRHHGPVGCCPDARLEDTPFEMLIQSITGWGILSTSLVFCENNLIRTRSTSLTSFDSFEYSLQTKFVATSFNLGDVWNGVSTIVANCSIRDWTSCINVQQDRLPLNLKEEVLSDPVNAWKRAMALHVVMPKFVAIVFREIILVVFPALKEIQISAAGFRALM